MLSCHRAKCRTSSNSQSGDVSRPNGAQSAPPWGHPEPFGLEYRHRQRRPHRPGVQESLPADLRRDKAAAIPRHQCRWQRRAGPQAVRDARKLALEIRVRGRRTDRRRTLPYCHPAGGSTTDRYYDDGHRKLENHSLENGSLEHTADQRPVRKRHSWTYNLNGDAVVATSAAPLFAKTDITVERLHLLRQRTRLLIQLRCSGWPIPYADTVAAGRP